MSFIQKFTKRDLGFSVLTGLIAGTIGWQVLRFLKVPELVKGYGAIIGTMCTAGFPSRQCVTQYAHYIHMPWSALVVIVPILWILGVLLGYFLGQWMEFFNQFGKFAAIGFTNFAVSAGVLNLLLAYTGYVKGIGYSLINSIAFVVALFASYVWNKYWAFKTNSNSRSSGQFVKVFLVTVVTFLVNLMIASAVVNLVHPAFGLDAHQWANVGTILGAAIGLIFSFIGFRIAVFK